MTRRRVVRSVDAPAGDRCVDLFLRPDGSYGFEEFRRDAEDMRGWYPVGGFSARRFATEAEATAAAGRAVAWFAELTG